MDFWHHFSSFLIIGNVYCCMGVSIFFSYAFYDRSESLPILNGNNVLNSNKWHVFLSKKLLHFLWLFKCSLVQSVKSVIFSPFAATIRICTYMWWCLRSVPVNWSRFSIASHPRQVTLRRKKKASFDYICVHMAAILLCCARLVISSLN